jgi:DNA-binding NarL/FixJ family response regulator
MRTVTEVSFRSAYDFLQESKLNRNFHSSPSQVPSQKLHLLVADSGQMPSHLLIAALRRRPEFEVTACAPDADSILATLKVSPAQVVLLNLEWDRTLDFSIFRRLHLAFPETAKVLLIDSYDRELVLNAFRSGIQGLFCLSRYPFRLLCKCIHKVTEGEIWADNEQTRYLVDGLSVVPSLQVLNPDGRKLLTPREEQVVALVSDGLTNRDVARELNLSEHTIKKYLFRIFDKLGVSSRVELVLYAVNHGQPRDAEWFAEI